jgi:RNA polymerase sigma-70 factor (ECF subfamily)
MRDKEIFCRLFSDYGLLIYRWAYNHSHSKYQAEEILQETFLKLWLNRNSLVGLRQPRAYVLRVARNTMIDRIRRQKKEVLEFEEYKRSVRDDLLFDPFQSEIRKSVKSSVQSALEKLPVKQRNIIQLKEEAWEEKRIARELRISISTVKNHLQMAKKNMRRSLVDLRA